MILRLRSKTKIQCAKAVFVVFIAVALSIFSNTGGAMEDDESTVGETLKNIKLRAIECSEKNPNAKIYLIDVGSVSFWPFVLVHSDKIISVGKYFVGNGFANYNWTSLPLNEFLEIIPDSLRDAKIWNLSDIEYLENGTVLITNSGRWYVGVAEGLAYTNKGKFAGDFYAFFNKDFCKPYN